MTKISAAISFVATLLAATAANATIYTSDGNLGDFTSGITNYATFSNYHDGSAPSSPTWTPTTATLNTDPRVFNWNGDPVAGLPSGNWLLATFTTPQDAIRVFPNIDHFGAGYDGFQYSIYGTNDGSTWTKLFDVTSAAGAGEPFTLGTYFGTAPTFVNNVLSPGTGPLVDGAGEQIGYIADFGFGSAYLEYAFGTSTYAGPLNSEQELSGVAAIPTPTTNNVPEPITLSLFGAGLAGAVTMRRRNRKPTQQ